LTISPTIVAGALALPLRRELLPPKCGRMRYWQQQGVGGMEKTSRQIGRSVTPDVQEYGSRSSKSSHLDGASEQLRWRLRVDPTLVSTAGRTPPGRSRSRTSRTTQLVAASRRQGNIAAPIPRAGGRRFYHCDVTALASQPPKWPVSESALKSRERCPGQRVTLHRASAVSG
jgi:hypothetical protein